jgi:hypothetical protein
MGGLLASHAINTAAQEKLNVFMNWTIHGQHGPWS